MGLLKKVRPALRDSTVDSAGATYRPQLSNCFVAKFVSIMLGFMERGEMTRRLQKIAAPVKSQLGDFARAAWHGRRRKSDDPNTRT